jgi:asparagine synthase (glutamine-hydrolysing)
VALTGDGGDESFAGYERYRAHALAGRVGVVPVLPGAAAGLVRRLPGGRSEPRSTPFRIGRFLEAAATTPAERYGRLMEIFPAEFRRELWTADALAEIGAPPTAGELLGEPPAPGLGGLQRLDIRTYLPGDLLFKADIASMACSLELRSPLLDHHVVELGLAVPGRLKARGRVGKIALRRAFANALPPEILARGKRGFGVPVSRWFREDLRELAGDVLLGERARNRTLFRRAAVEGLLREHVAGRADHGARLWSLVMLELWLERYADGRSASPRVSPRLTASA